MLLKILETDTFGIHWVPLKLASLVVGVTMKGWDNAMETKVNLLQPKNTVLESLYEGTHNIVTEADI